MFSILINNESLLRYFRKCPVPILNVSKPKAKDLFPQLKADEHWNEEFVLELEKNFNEKDCYMCKNLQPEEGIVLRKETMHEYEVYKLKSKRFLLGESDDQEKEVANIEDSQTEE